jgi:two-component sensor histidine kinase
VHELSTNAAKYGALSSANGEVVVDWQLGGTGTSRYMEFSWREKGGPLVVPTKHQGFGLSLITAMGSNATSRPVIEFAPEGFSCTLRVPLETIAPTRYDRASPMLAAGHGAPRRAAGGGPAT